MLTVWRDFNARSDDDRCWILHVNHRELEGQLETLGLRDGDRVLLFQDDRDFKVEAVLRLKQRSDVMPGERACAIPDWGTMRRLA